MAFGLLVVGYVLAVPLTVFVPGFLRLWRRREPLLFTLAQAGAAAIVLGWALRGDLISAAVNAVWLAGFAAAYALEGRKRGRHHASHPARSAT